MSVSEECQADSGVSAPGPGAGRGEESSGETCGNLSYTAQETGRREEKGAGRDWRERFFTSQLLFGGVRLNNKP